MRRHRDLFRRVTSFENLALAARKAFRGKKSKPRVEVFFFSLEPELFRLQEELRQGTYRPRTYRVFEIFEPKRRMIAAADFRDRVVHHAICNYLDPILEGSMVSDSYACRRGKGTHAAVGRTQRFCRQFGWFLKCDIQKYFDSVDHAVLKALLRRKLNDPELLRLLDQIIDHPLLGQNPGRGIPIGNLTSQYFANFYLGQLDHWVKDRLGLKGYIRYMDDFLVFADCRERLRRLLPRMKHFVQEKLSLELNNRRTLLAPIHQGVPFLGFRVFPGLIRLSSDRVTRLRRKVKRRERAFLDGEITQEAMTRSVSSMIGHVVHADSRAVRRRLFENSWA